MEHRREIRVRGRTLVYFKRLSIDEIHFAQVGRPSIGVSSIPAVGVCLSLLFKHPPVS